MEGYSVSIKETNRELTARERIMLKDTTNAIKLDEATKEAPLEIEVIGFAILEVHNEKSSNKDYEQYIIIDKDEQKYVTGSSSFWSSFWSIYDEMANEGEESFTIKCYRVPSKNYNGKEFITCSII